MGSTDIWLMEPADRVVKFPMDTMVPVRTSMPMSDPYMYGDAGKNII